jgi:hypothetical protein
MVTYKRELFLDTIPRIYVITENVIRALHNISLEIWFSLWAFILGQVSIFTRMWVTKVKYLRLLCTGQGCIFLYFLNNLTALSLWWSKSKYTVDGSCQPEAICFDVVKRPCTSKWNQRFSDYIYIYIKRRRSTLNILSLSKKIQNINLNSSVQRVFLQLI